MNINKRLTKQKITLSKNDISKLDLDNSYIQMLNNSYDSQKRLDLLIVRCLGSYKFKGAMYLKDIVQLLIKEDMSITQMYKLVAKKYDTEWNAVERDIRKFKEQFWIRENKVNDNIKVFLFGNLAYNETITNSDFLYGIVQFLLTDFNIKDNTEERLENCENSTENTAYILSDFAKDTKNFPVSKEKKERLGCFYWILGKLAENLGDYVYEKNTDFKWDKSFYYLKIVLKYLENGKVVLILKDKPSYTYCVSNEDIVYNVINIIQGLENYYVSELNEKLTEFTVWLEKE